MELKLKRLLAPPSGEQVQIGELYIDGVFECYTLEDKVREVEGRPVAEWKIKGKTAIPRGWYRVKMTPSPKYKRIMPQVMDVPGFSGIRIHSGNTDKDTDGCLLLGTAKGDKSIYNSVPAVTAFVEKLQSAIARGEEVWITVA